MEDDNRVDMELDITDDDFLAIARMAHERDITFNKMVEELLIRCMEQEKREDRTEE